MKHDNRSIQKLFRIGNIITILLCLTVLSGIATAHGIAEGLPLSNLQALVLGLTVALMWGLVPVITKRGYTYGGTSAVAISIIVVSGVVIMWGSLLFVYALQFISPGEIPALLDISPIALLAFFVGGLVGTALGRIAMYAGVDRVGANITSGVIATNSLPALVLGYLFLQEVITSIRLVGIGMIIMGLVVLSLSKGGDVRGWTLRDLTAPLVAAIAFGTGHVLRRFGLTYGLTKHGNPLEVATPLQAAAVNELAATIGILAFTVGYKRVHRDLRDISQKAYLYFIAAGIVSAIGLYVEFRLLVHEKAAIVTALVATQAVFATIFSYSLLGDIERITKKMIVAVGIVVIGLTLLGL